MDKVRLTECVTFPTHQCARFNPTRLLSPLEKTVGAIAFTILTLLTAGIFIIISFKINAKKRNENLHQQNLINQTAQQRLPLYTSDKNEASQNPKLPSSPPSGQFFDYSAMQPPRLPSLPIQTLVHSNPSVLTKEKLMNYVNFAIHQPSEIHQKINKLTERELKDIGSLIINFEKSINQHLNSPNDLVTTPYFEISSFESAHKEEAHDAHHFMQLKIKNRFISNGIDSYLTSYFPEDNHLSLENLLPEDVSAILEGYLLTTHPKIYISPILLRNQFGFRFGING